MTKRRPSAVDRDIANVLRRLPAGDYLVRVEFYGEQLVGFGTALLKPEGGAVIDLADKRIIISPQPREGQNAQSNRGAAASSEPASRERKAP